MEYTEELKIKDLKVLLNLDFWFMTAFSATSLIGIVDLLNSPHEWVKAVVAFMLMALLVDKFAPKFLK